MTQCLTPLERYKSDLERPEFSYDEAQERAVTHLDRLYHDLVLRKQKVEAKGFFSRFSNKAKVALATPAMGLYFWGGVGRGKTYLVDTFYESLPFEQKMRIHFHRFMRRIHRELTNLQGSKDPLSIVADRLAAEACVICFDEFFVSDITDAMILGGMMERLFDRGVTLVATSNIIPDRLYENGLQRTRFLPAIDLINTFTEIVNVDSGIDYRLRALERAEIYHSPLDAGADESLRKSFDSLAPEPGHAEEVIEIEGRPIETIMVADDVLWCEFDALCNGPRSQNDYIELSRIYHAVLISNVPVMNGLTDDLARRFINLVDEFYDRNVKLIMSAEAAIESLYGNGQLEFEFQRTQSRLLEMQSHEYLAREHKP